MTPPLRVCCTAYHAYPVIEPSAEGVFGGTETRAWLLAKGLAAASDLEVCLLVRTRRPLVQDRYEGVLIVRRPGALAGVREAVSSCVDRLPGFPWLRIRRWRWPLVWQIPLLAAAGLQGRQPDPDRPDPFFQRLPVDVFCSFGVHRDSATVIASAKALSRKSLLFLGADSDLDERIARGGAWRTVYGERASVCRFALTQADCVVVQTSWQQQTLRQRFGRDSMILANPIDVAAWETAAGQEYTLPEAAGMRPYALWIGRADAFHKRPIMLLDVARQCPDVDFLMILNPRDPAVEERVVRLRPPNVRIVSRLAFAEMPLAFRGAAVYVNTSSPDYEGFPNVFLQAAAAGVPIASLELDPGFVEKERCGLVAHGDVPRLAEYLRAVVADRQRGREEGARGYAYVRQHHDLPTQAARLAELLRRLCG